MNQTAPKRLDTGDILIVVSHVPILVWSIAPGWSTTMLAAYLFIIMAALCCKMRASTA